MSYLNRAKGFAYEEEVANKFKSLGWHNAIRNPNIPDYGVDILNTEPFLIQCKRRKTTYASAAKINEIRRCDGIHLLLTRDQYRETLGVLRWKDLECIIKVLKDYDLLHLIKPEIL